MAKKKVQPKPTSSEPASFEDVLEQEMIEVVLRREAWYRAIQGTLNLPGESTQQQIQGTRRDPFDLRLFGLALSGGGIRSATFCLGVLQTLGKLKLLSRLDYLSTVSGGGYIGGWFSSLLHRTIEADHAEVEQQAKDRGLGARDAEREVLRKARGIFRLEQELGQNEPEAGSVEAAHPENENPSIGFLRRYSNYLTPKVGFLSADTWTAVATYLRNLLLNFAILVALAGVVLLTPRFVTAGLIHAESLHLLWVVVPAILLILLATSLLAVGLMDLETRESEGGIEPTTVIFGSVFPLIGASVLLSVALASPMARQQELWEWWLGTAVAAIGVYGLAGVFACLYRSLTAKDEKKKEAKKKTTRWWPQGWLVWLCAGVGISLAAAPVLWALARTRAPGGLLADDWLAAAWAPPLLILWLVSFGAFQTGLAGTALHDSQREWLNRLGAWLLISAGIWNLAFLLILFGPPFLMSVGPIFRTLLVGGWIGTTLAGLLTARSTGGQQSGLGGRFVLATAPWIFVAGFVLSVTLALDWSVDRVSTVLPSPQIPYSWSDWMDSVEDITLEFEEWEFLHAHDPLTAGATPPRVWSIVYGQHLELLDATRLSLYEVGCLVVILLVIAVVLGWRVDINEFSMHGFYRNRLVRAYLGASRKARRRQNPVTGFSRQDDIRLQELHPDYATPRFSLPRPPLHLINTAVNMVTSEELAWQERNAASFVLSPYFCGFETRRERQEELDRRRIEDKPRGEGYRRTGAGFGDSPADLTLGGAVATSGAAVSPNMGFHTSPALAALLTLFNVRLGRWIGNPGDKEWQKSGPLVALGLLVQEILRGTSRRKKYLYLSDGGHFENLGIYELVRRRCRYVIAVDAGADPDMSFADLGNAIRKCRIDLRVKIEVDLEPLKMDAEGLSRWHCIVGNIRYPEEPDHVGTLLYLKSSLTGDEDADVLEYRSVHEEFPHQSTGDQFFDESQFESYRALGRHAAQEALEWAVQHARKPVESKNHHEDHDGWPPHEVVDLETMRRNLEHRWRAPSTATAEAFTRHAAALDELYDRARNSTDLRFLDPQVYPEWDQIMEGVEPTEKAQLGQAGTSALRLPSTERERRAGFYYCYSLIQLMENVYHDLDLASDLAHPDNRGWMNLFRHWTWSAMFRVTWSVAAATFGRRFQSFCEKELGMSQGRVAIHPLWRQTEPKKPQKSQEPQEPRDFRPLREILQDRSDDEPFLNFLETEQATLFADLMDGAELTEVTSFRLEVDALDPEQEGKLLSFPVGYALLGRAAEGPTQILLFRIQDHLRKLGLGREALAALIEWLDPDDQQLPYSGEPFNRVLSRLEHEHDLASAGTERFVQEFGDGLETFSELAESVMAERSNRRRLASS